MFQIEEAKLWCFEGRGKSQASNVYSGGHNRQVLEHGKLAIYGRNDLLQTRSRHLKVYALDPITAPEGKRDSFFLFHGEIVVLITMEHNEWKGR